MTERRKGRRKGVRENMKGEKGGRENTTVEEGGRENMKGEEGGRDIATVEDGIAAAKKERWKKALFS